VEQRSRIHRPILMPVKKVSLRQASPDVFVG
jgi:hypothetical protein